MGVEDNSLGSPLNAVPLDVPGVVDQTRGILTYVEANCLSPKSLGIEWICLAGTYKTGVKEFSRERFSDFIVGQGYKQVCGTADARGDGITPVESAQLQLEGVENIIWKVSFTPQSGRIMKTDRGTAQKNFGHVGVQNMTVLMYVQV